MKAINAVISEDIKQEQPVFKSWFKDDFQKIDTQINDLRKELNEVKKDINRLEVRMSEYKTDTIRWLMAFWFGQMAVLAGVLMYFLRR